MLKIQDVKVGDKLICDGGFTCLREGEIVMVQADGCELFVPCADNCLPLNPGLFVPGAPPTERRYGKHYLAGQIDDEEGVLVGLGRAP